MIGEGAQYIKNNNWGGGTVHKEFETRHQEKFLHLV